MAVFAEVGRAGGNLARWEFGRDGQAIAAAGGPCPGVARPNRRGSAGPLLWRKGEASEVSVVGRRLTRRRSAGSVERRRWDSGRRGRRLSDVRGLGPPPVGGGFGRRLGRRTSCGQGRADSGLAQVEPFPEALPGLVTAKAVGGADGGGQGADGGAQEKGPHSAGGQAQASDFVRAPDAESPAATGPCVAVAAKDSPRSHGFSLGVALIKSQQKAMPNQRAQGLAERARRQLEPFHERVPFVGVMAKPALLAHWPTPLPKIAEFSSAEKCGVVAGYDKIILERGAG